MRTLIPVYSVTLLLSAVLLFSVQPMFTKMILPLLGGTPQVWNTAMLFFQACLLGGYAYAHGTSRYLGIRSQAILHIILLTLCAAVLPFAIPAGWEPPTDRDPTLWQLSLMALTVGGPFFVIAGSAPMLQHWFGQSGHKDAGNPYFLYGASNLGSMTALLTYPVLTEPMLDLSGQTHLWMIGYLLLILMTATAALSIWKQTAFASPRLVHIQSSEKISNALRLRWLILSAIPSSLMLGVTTYITTDIAAVPLLWVIPLALYVATFIIVFARRPLISTDHLLGLIGIVLAVAASTLFVFNLLGKPYSMIGLNLGLFFFLALYLHNDLARAKPSPTNLTEFYMFMSLGGVIGGFFNAIIAPLIFNMAIEYQLMIIVSVIIPIFDSELKNSKRLFQSLSFGMRSLIIGSFSIFILLILVTVTSSPTTTTGNGYVFQDRNFFGVTRVFQDSKERVLFHGTTIHGKQSLDEKSRLIPLSYYSAISPLADILKSKEISSLAPQKIAALGLGVGSIACYAQQGRSYDFFEIDKDMKAIAENPSYFTYLRDCGSPYNIILGDARLTLAKKENSTYDIMVVDAFSSDNIPIHLITLEAIKMYLTKLKPDGALLFHISNNHLDLEPILGNAARYLGIKTLSKINLDDIIPETDIAAYPSQYVVLTNNESLHNELRQQGWEDTVESDKLRLWTDQYSNIISVMGGQSFAQKNIKIVKERKKEKAKEPTSSP